MKNCNWLLPLLCLVASPLYATTVDTFYDTDCELSWHKDGDESRRDTDDAHHNAWRGHRKTYFTRNNRPFQHKGAGHRHTRRGHRKIHFTDSFEIEQAGTYHVYLEDLDHEALPVDFAIKVTAGKDRYFGYIRDADSLLFEAPPGKYKITIWAKAHHEIYRDEFDVHIAPWKVASVPVPAAVWLFCSGLLGLMGVAWRKTA